MTKYLLLLIIPLLLGCRVKRSLSVQTDKKAEYYEQKDVHEHKAESRDSVGQKITEVVSKKESDTETEKIIKTTEYDTSKPVDPATGRPPVLRETESTTRTKKKDKEDIIGQQEESISVTDQKDRTKIDQSSATTKQIKATAEKKEKKSGSRSWLFFILGGIGLFYIINKKFSLFR